MKKQSYYLRSSFALLITFLFLSFGSRAQIDVSATGGTVFSSYPTLKDAFDAINAGTHMGAITIDVWVNTTETTSCVLNSSGAGSASYTSVLIRPQADGVSISGPSAQGRGLIELNGADNVTIDGDNPNTAGTNRNLSLINTAANTTTYTSVVRIAVSTLITSANDNIIKNCIITGSATGRNIATATSTTASENASWGILVSGNASTTTATTAPSAVTSTTGTTGTTTTVNNFVVDNNRIMSCGRGIACNGNAQAVFGGTNGLSITNNFIGNTTVGDADQVYSMGITASGFGTTTTSVISGNTVYVESYIGTAIRGIDIGSASTASAGMTIEHNYINRVHMNAGTNGAYGIQIAGTTGSNTIVRNNMITDINSDITSNIVSNISGDFGIRLSSGTGHKIYHNSVNLYGPFLGGSGSVTTAALCITSTGVTGADIRNNIFANTKSGASATSTYSSVYLPSGATSSMNLTINNNAYYEGSVSGQSGILQVSTTLSATSLYTAANFNASLTTPSTNMRAYTSPLSAAGTNDNTSYASSNAAPFMSATDLHLNLNSSEISNIEQKGDVTVPVASDIDGDTRPNATTTFPDIGADEAIYAPCVTATGGTTSVSSSTVCEGETFVLTATGASADVGISYQWQVATVSGGPYTNVTGGSGANTVSYTSGTITAGTYYYVLQVTCSNGPVVANSTETSVTVNATPVVTVSPTSATYCQGGTPVTLTASGATTYSWSPSTGLSSATAAVVDASPTSNTTYIVTGTTNGCSSTDTAVISSSVAPVIDSVTATPENVCSGANSQLQVYSSVPALVNTYSFTAGTGSSLDPMTGATQLIGSGVDDTPMASPTSIGFNFVFNGVSYSQFSASPDGWIRLGSGTATSQFTNSVVSVTNIPKIYPLWDDLTTGTDGYVRSVVTGTAPNRVLIVEWFVTVPGLLTGAANATFQAWLYESSNNIEFRYGTIGTATSSSGGLTAGSTNYQSLTFSSNTASTTAANNTNTVTPASGTIYTFSPPSQTYAWSPATFLNSTVISNPLASAVTSSIVYSVTVTSPNGCFDTSSISITAGTPLSATAAVTPNDTVCEGTSPVLEATPIGGGGPYTYSWAGPNGFTSTSQNPTLPNFQTADAGTYTVTVTDNCSAVTTAQVVVAMISQPSIAVTPATGLICNPGGTAVSLVASGSSVSYSWSPTTGLTPATGDTVSALPTSTTVYTVTGTASNGCTSVATATITVSNTPVFAEVSATPSGICSGDTSQLFANAYAPTQVNQYLFSAGTGTTLDPMTGATELIASGVDDTPVGPLAIGFTFNFNGTSYTQFSVSPDGWIRFGSGTPTVQTINNVTSATNTPKIYPYWDEIATGTTGNVSSVITGTAPNRILKVQWVVTIPQDVAGPANSTFQAWLYEATGVVEFRYGTINTSTAGTASGGMTGGTTNYQSLTFSTNTASTTVGNNANQFAPASGTIYTFTPPLITYSWAPTAFLNDPAIANPLAENVTATTIYTVTATSDAGCVATGSDTVSTDALSAVTLTTSPSTTVCAGISVTMSSAPVSGGSPFSYAWSSGQTTASIIETPTVTTTYTVTITDNCGTAISNSVTITVDSVPAVAVTPISSTFCNPGSPVSLTATGAQTYSWLPATGLSGTTGSAVNADPTVNTTYTVTGTYTTNGCTATATANVVFANVVPITSVSVTPSIICSGGSAQLNATSTASQVLSTYNFNSGSGTTLDPMTGATTVITSGIDDTPTAAPAAIGFTFPFNGTNYTQFSVSPDGWILLGGATATSQFTNSVTSTTNIPKIYPYWDDVATGTTGSVKTEVIGTSPNQILIVEWFVTIPRATAGPANSTFQAWLYETTGKIEFRYGAMGVPSLNSSSSGATAAAANYKSITFTTNSASSTSANNANVGTPANGTIYTLTPLSATYSWSPGTSLSDSTLLNPVSNVTSSTTYTLTALANNGCVATETVTLTVNPTPVAPTTSVSAICSGSATTATVTSTGTATLGWYDAATGGNYLGGGTTFTTPTLTTGATYYVQDSSAAGCIGPRTQVNVTVNPNPVVNLGTDSTRCGGSVTLDAQNAGATYVWSNAATTQTTTVTSTGTYDVTITDVNGCTDSDTITVTINPVPSVSLGADVDSCANSLQLNAQNAGSSYLWNTAETSQTIAVTASGSYDVIVTNPEGCNGYDTIAVVLKPTPVVNLGNDTALCGGNILLDAQNTGSSYLWNDGSTASINFVLSSGTYWVDVTNPQNCTVRDTIIVTINAVPAVNLGQDVALCDGDTAVLDAGAITGATYTWSDNSTAQTLAVDATGSYSVFVTTGPNCDAADTINVTVNPNPVVTLSLTTTSVCENGNPVALSGESPAGGTFSGTGVNGTLFDPTAVAGTSSVIVYDFTDVNGCTGSANDTITLIAAPVVTLALTQDTACADDGIVTLAGENPAGGTYSGTSVSGNSFDPSAGAGTYVITYSYTDMGTGCSNTATDNFVVDVCTGAAFDYLNTLNVYPNPNKGEFFIEFASGEGTPVAELFTLQGKKIFSRQLDATTRNVVGVKELSNGIYMLRITYEGRVKNVKLTVTQ